MSRSEGVDGKKTTGFRQRLGVGRTILSLCLATPSRSSSAPRCLMLSKGKPLICLIIVLGANSPALWLIIMHQENVLQTVGIAAEGPKTQKSMPYKISALISFSALEMAFWGAYSIFQVELEHLLYWKCSREGCVCDMRSPGPTTHLAISPPSIMSPQAFGAPQNHAPPQGNKHTMQRVHLLYVRRCSSS